jgi:dCTP deaminase
MILGSAKIFEALYDKDIEITPFNIANVGPNSVDLTLAPRIFEMQKRGPLTQERPWFLDEPVFEEDCIEWDCTRGLLLQAGHFYIASTAEWTSTKEYVPMIEGRSSVGRHGLFIHITAGFGDIGFKGHWTLELYPTVDIVVKAGTRICQIFYHTIEGKGDTYEQTGRYQNQSGTTLGLQA